MNLSAGSHHHNMTSWIFEDEESIFKSHHGIASKDVLEDEESIFKSHHGITSKDVLGLDCTAIQFPLSLIYSSIDFQITCLFSNELSLPPQ